MITRAFKIRRRVRVGAMALPAAMKRLTAHHGWDETRAAHFLGMC